MPLASNGFQQPSPLLLHLTLRSSKEHRSSSKPRLSAPPSRTPPADDSIPGYTPVRRGNHTTGYIVKRQARSRTTTRETRTLRGATATNRVQLPSTFLRLFELSPSLSLPSPGEDHFRGDSAAMRERCEGHYCNAYNTLSFLFECLPISNSLILGI